ncbi:hypothetical protein BCR39DRAFT_530975 [Naematelia encephala]|uniref:Uncharacterized protein n=1 Tax=Naematelia encephala TaxID=71784 RepID=A0A1Y2B6P1_9TREE|nr:hypothetical protein BCR39DRAFT_530975 [Naematelia encephala]
MDWFLAHMPWCWCLSSREEQTERDPLLPQFPPPDTILTPPRPHGQLPSPIHTGVYGPYSAPMSPSTGRPDFSRTSSSPGTDRSALERRARREALERDFSGRMRGSGFTQTQPPTPNTADSSNASSPSTSTRPRSSASRLLPRSVSDPDTTRTYADNQRSASSSRIVIPRGRGRRRSASVYQGVMSPILSVGFEGEEGMTGRLGRSRSVGGQPGLTSEAAVEEDVTRLSLGLRGMGSTRKGRSRGRSVVKTPRQVTG